MCIIAAKPSGWPLPSNEILSNCEWNNRDGIGIAWSSGQGVKIKKDFATLTAFQEWLPANVQESDACIIHFRMATHGKVSEGMRHPFPLTKDEATLQQVELECDMAMAHNGILDCEDKRNKLSDTAVFVRDILAEPAVRDNLRDNAAIQKLIAHTATASNKLAFLFGDGHILYFGEFETDKGILYSNGQYSWGLGKTKQESYLSGKWRNLEVCHVCYKDFNKKVMVPFQNQYGVMEYACRKCVQSGGSLETMLKDKELVYGRCDICQEAVMRKHLKRVDTTTPQEKESFYLTCRECAAEMSRYE